jgi:cytochrome c peroxidase
MSFSIKQLMKSWIVIIIASVVIALGFVRDQIDDSLTEVIEINGLAPLKRVQSDSATFELGRMLFFDKILSGNKDISCATCHHPSLNSGDQLSLSIGSGGEGLGGHRQMGKQRHRIPRNSPEIFNRGAEGWHTMFWDGRVAAFGESEFDTRAEDKLLEGLDNVLAAQAMFPVLARDEMRGRIGDTAVDGTINELALISNGAPGSIWRAIMERILSIDGYCRLFKEAFPEVSIDKIGFQHAANAIAAFESQAFSFVNSPWDRYLSGDLETLTAEAKRGALLFYGTAQCAACHSGNLMTDQKFYNLGVPQFGPGKGDGRPYDYGRYAETGLPDDRFAFRTPPLRNVAITGPWMHNGAYNTMKGAILHHFDPVQSLLHYDPGHLEESLQETYRGDEESVRLIMQTLDTTLADKGPLSQAQVDDLISFLEALTDPSALDLRGTIPLQVPSGLAVETNTAHSY